MADNPTVNGIVVATDDRGGAQYQRILPGGASSADNGTVTISTSAQTPVLPANGVRRDALFQNTSDAIVYFGYTNTLTPSTGVVIAPGCAMSSSYTGNLYLVVATGTAVVRYAWEGD